MRNHAARDIRLQTSGSCRVRWRRGPGVRHAEHGASRKTLLDCFHHGRMAMPGHESAEAQVVIDVFVSVEVAKPAALCVLHKDRIGIISAVVARYPEWDTFEIALVRLSRFWRAALEEFELVLKCWVHYLS